MSNINLSTINLCNNLNRDLDKINSNVLECFENLAYELKRHSDAIKRSVINLEEGRYLNNFLLIDKNKPEYNKASAKLDKLLNRSNKINDNFYTSLNSIIDSFIDIGLKDHINIRINKC